MSINSLLTNNTVLSRLEQIIKDRLPFDDNGIQDLQNNDGNVSLSVVGHVGNCNLENDISVQSINCNTVHTNMVSDNDGLNIEGISNLSSLNLTNNEIQFKVENKTLTFDTNNNLTFSNNLDLVTNSMLNIFSQVGQNNQVLQTDGQGNLSFVTQSSSDETGKQKFINYYLAPLLEEQGSPIDFYTETFTGLNIGARLIIEVGCTFYVLQSGLVSIQIKIDNNIIQTTSAYVNTTSCHVFRGCISTFVNTSTSHTLDVSIVSDDTSIYVNPTDYGNVLVYEVQI